jgi:magnesium-transporting ATPase (P-type)
MSVIVKNQKANQCFVYCKGAPKLMESFCVKESLPKKYQAIVHNLCKNGLRVITFAFKQINEKCVEQVNRDQVEKDLFFLGFYIMENQLKPETKDTISTLKKFNKKNIMISGDNIYTCISVSLNSGIIDNRNEILIGEAEFIGDNDTRRSSALSLSSQRRHTLDENSCFLKNEFQKDSKLIEIITRSNIELSEFTKISGSRNMYTFGNRFEFDLLNLFHNGKISSSSEVYSKIDNYLTLMTTCYQVNFISIGFNLNQSNSFNSKNKKIRKDF